jgi:hypothetical protein
MKEMRHHLSATRSDKFLMPAGWPVAAITRWKLGKLLCPHSEVVIVRGADHAIITL